MAILLCMVQDGTALIIGLAGKVIVWQFILQFPLRGFFCRHAFFFCPCLFFLWRSIVFNNAEIMWFIILFVIKIWFWFDAVDNLDVVGTCPVGGMLFMEVTARPLWGHATTLHYKRGKLQQGKVIIHPIFSIQSDNPTSSVVPFPCLCRWNDTKHRADLIKQKPPQSTFHRKRMTYSEVCIYTTHGTEKTGHEVIFLVDDQCYGFAIWPNLPGELFGCFTSVHFTGRQSPQSMTCCCAMKPTISI